MRQRIRWLLLAAALPAGGCFVSEGDCIQRGVAVEPCRVQLRPGQSVVLTARVVGASNEPVIWLLPDSAMGAFTALDEGNRLTLISKLNVPASFPVQASSAADTRLYGGSVVGVTAATFGSQPPPFVHFGGDLPVGSKDGATAVGGNLYYVAYADSSPDPIAGVPGGGGESANLYLKQYRLADNALLADVPGQFSQFTGPDSTFTPNVAADCDGTGYWFDLVNPPQGFALRRLGEAASLPDEHLFDPGFEFVITRSLAASCDGMLYFIAQLPDATMPPPPPPKLDPLPAGGLGPQELELFRLDSFGAPLRVVRFPEIPGFAFLYQSLAVDDEGRLLAGSAFSDGTAPLLRFTVAEDTNGILVATVDPTFVVMEELAGVGAVAVDRVGVVYAAANRFPPDPGGGPLGGFDPSFFDVLIAFNALGEAVYEIAEYPYECPPLCALPECGELVPFRSIRSVGAAADGRLRIVDDVEIDPTAPAPCQETLRLILLDPE